MSSERRLPWYHYTSEEGLHGILRNGRINPSDPRNGDACEGYGTYGTNYPPSTRTSTIARNNWDAGWREAIAHGKMDHYIRCEIPETELQRHWGHGQGTRGEIRLHPEGVDLSKYPTSGHSTFQDFAIPGLATPPPSRGGRGQTNTPPKTEAPCGWPPYPGAGSLAPIPCWGQDSSDDDCPKVHHHGCNAEGNSYTSFTDGSYHYDNQDGSSYNRHADGSATYTSPSGYEYEYPSTDHGETLDCPDGDCHGGGGHDDSGNDDSGGHGYDDGYAYGGCEDEGGYDDDGYDDCGGYDYDSDGEW